MQWRRNLGTIGITIQEHEEKNSLGNGEKNHISLKTGPIGTSNCDLGVHIKHPECVDRIVAELSDGTEIEAGLLRPEGLTAYRIEYKVGPCMDNCPRVEALAEKHGMTDYAEKGCYNGRVDRVTLEEIEMFK